MDASDAARIAEAKQALERVIGDKRIKGKPLLMYASSHRSESHVAFVRHCLLHWYSFTCPLVVVPHGSVSVQGLLPTALLITATIIHSGNFCTR